ncbi:MULTISPECIES: hypothetical protein [unclassified Thermoplasma]|uniref:hypothetical protein n=1 Tax=unclassified Thermoplasma TaxID=2684908 RepID=UPI000D9F958A|nr:MULTISPECIES: hypothetical protein [unclassified Thermoplasma]PYB69090.1 hypothetical protein DMB44_00600 [Thermoplasma sp. Kam2015]
MPVNANIRKYNSVFILIITALLAYGLGYFVSYFESLFLLVFLVPIVILILMHYLGLYGLKKRLIYGVVIVFIAALLISSAESQVYYSTDHPVSASYGSITATANVRPFSGNFPAYNFSLALDNYKDLKTLNFSLHIASSAYSANITTQLKNYTSGNQMIVYYVAPSGSLPLGIYNYTFTFANYSLTAPGPINAPLNTWLADSVLFATILYFIYYEIILLAGIFLMRSIEHSRSYRNKK